LQKENVLKGLIKRIKNIDGKCGNIMVINGRNIMVINGRNNMVISGKNLKFPTFRGVGQGRVLSCVLFNMMMDEMIRVAEGQ
jgi:hypothetical protein